MIETYISKRHLKIYLFRIGSNLITLSRISMYSPCSEEAYTEILC